MSIGAAFLSVYAHFAECGSAECRSWVFGSFGKIKNDQSMGWSCRRMNRTEWYRHIDSQADFTGRMVNYAEFVVVEYNENMSSLFCIICLCKM